MIDPQAVAAEREFRASLPPVHTQEPYNHPADQFTTLLVVPLNGYQSATVMLDRTQAAQAITALATWLATTPQEEK